MRKLIALLLVIGAACVMPAAGSPSGGGDVVGPSFGCLDIINNAGAGYDGTTGLVTIGVQLAGPVCKQFDVNVVIGTAEGDQALTLAHTNDTGDILIFQGTVNTATNPTITFYGSTSTNGGHHVFDRAPDSGTLSIAKNNNGGFLGFS